MTDIVELLRSGLYDVNDKAADEIESLRQQLAERERLINMTYKVQSDLRQQLAESQAREKVRIEALEKLARLGNGERYGNSKGNTIAIEALALPSDSTALDSATRQAKRDALLEAAEVFNCEPSGQNQTYPQFYSTHIWGVLRRMAEELKG